MTASSSRHPCVPPGVVEERESSPSLLLAVLGHTAMRRLRDAHTTHDLNPRQVQLLARLHDRGTMGQRELGQAMGAAPSILVTLLNPLEADGYILRERDAADRRRHVVTLTPAGERHLDRAVRVQREVDDTLFASLDHKQREDLRTLLLAVRRSLTPAAKPNSPTITGEQTAEHRRAPNPAARPRP